MPTSRSTNPPVTNGDTPLDTDGEPRNTPDVAVASDIASRETTGCPSMLERLTPEVRFELVDRIRHGAPFTVAAVSVGVSKRTFQRWLEKGRREDPAEPYASFVEEVEQAFADWQVSCVKAVDEAGIKDYRARIWLLERRNPAEFGDPRRGDVNVQVNLAALVESPDWRRVESSIVDALRPHPEALRDVVRALSTLQPSEHPVLEAA